METLMGIKIYKVKYWEKYKGSLVWGKTECNVAVYGDAIAAIKKAQKSVIGMHIKDGIWNDGKRKLSPITITDFRPIGVELLAEAEFE
jgi:hypothetical protein